jgi:hypothetical protein
MTNQTNTREFKTGDRIIYMGEYIGTLISPVGAVGGLEWRVQWDDGADTTDSSFPQAKMVHANGGPASGKRTVPELARIKAEALREAAADLPFLDRDTNMLVRQQNASHWLLERADEIERAARATE